MGRLSKSGEGTHESLNRVATTSAVAGAGIAAGLALAARSALNFEKQISAIGAVSGATEGDLERLRAKALKLGEDTSFGATEAAQAMEELAKSGLSVDEILNGAADATVALAAAGGVDLKQAAELAADAMNSFSLKASDMPRIADLIAGAANSSSISVGDFEQSLKQVGAVANLVGISFDDTAVAIALMGQAGIKGSDAGTSLKTMLSNLIPVTKEQKTLFKELGLTLEDGSNAFFDAQGNAKGLAEVAGILQNATKGMTAEQKQLTLETLFGSDAIRAAAIMTKAGATGFQDMATKMGSVSAEAVALQRLDNTAGDIERLKGAAESAAISLGEMMLPAIRKILQAVTGFANAFNGLSDSTKSVIINVGLITSSFLLLLALAVKMFQFAQAVSVMVTLMKTWAIWSKLAAAGTVLWAAAQWALNAAIAFITSPIGLVVIAIIALIAAIVLLWKNSETFRNIVIAVWEHIKSAVSNTVNWFTGTVVPALVSAWNGIVAAFQTAKNAIAAVLNAIVVAFGYLTTPIKAFLAFIAPAFSAAWNLVKTIVLTAITAIQAIFAVYFAIWRAIITTALNAIRAVFTTVWNAIKAVVTGVMSFLQPYISAAVNAIRNVITSAWNTVRNITGTVWNAIKAVITAAWNAIKPTVTAATNAVRTSVTNAWNTIRSISTSVWNAIKSVISSAWSAIKSLVSSAVSNVISTMNRIQQIVSAVRNFFNQLKTAASGGTSSLIAFVRGIPGRVVAAFGNMGSLLYNKGRQLIQGFVNGIKSMIGAAASAARSAVSAVANFLPGSPAKEGPLSGKGYVLKRGQRFVSDFATGILASVAQAKKAASTMVGDIAMTLPNDNTGAVATASGAVTLAAPSVAPASNHSESRAITIGAIRIDGTWDLADQDVPREFVARLYEELDRYERAHK